MVLEKEIMQMIVGIYSVKGSKSERERRREERKKREREREKKKTRCWSILLASLKIPLKSFLCNKDFFYFIYSSVFKPNKSNYHQVHVPGIP